MTALVFYNANTELVNAMKDGATPTVRQLRDAQVLVYNLNNVVPFKTGYYRLHSPLGISDIEPVRYVSGYTHKIELDEHHDDTGDYRVPMHFYEENTSQVRTFTDLKTGFISSNATRGDLQILPVERDPASIFYFKSIYDKPDDPNSKDYRKNFAYICTEDLYVKGAKGRVVYTSPNPETVVYSDNVEGVNERAAALMTETPPPTTPTPQQLVEDYAYTSGYSINNYPTPFFVMDIGGGILLIHDNETKWGRKYLKYLSYDHSFDEKVGKSTIYGMKMTHNTHTDHAKFCMQPVQQSATKGVNEMGLKLNLRKGGDDFYYASFYAPYDVLLTDDKNDAAYICLVWDTEMLHLKKVGKFNLTENGCPTRYKGSNQFVPAHTPVIIRSANTSVTMALPTPEKPSDPLITGITYKHGDKTETVKNIFTGVCLEQLLSEENTVTNDVYTFGLPVKGTATKHEYYSSSGNAHNGEITIALPQTEESGVGFYINANYNREAYAAMGGWTRNNRYVYNNKIYVRNPITSGSGARLQTFSSDLDFIPVVFDDDEEEDEPIEESLLQRPHDNRVYDLLGRCVASGEEVVNGTWRSKVASGIYILNGRKVYVK